MAASPITIIVVPEPVTQESLDTSGYDLASIDPFVFHPLLRENFTDENADIVFVVEESDKTVPAHKSVLSVASPIFFKMFNGDWKEKYSQRISLPKKYSFETFSAVLRFLYGETINLKDIDVVELYEAAHFYDLGNLMNSIGKAVRMFNSSNQRDREVIVRLCGTVEACESNALCNSNVYEALLKFTVTNIGDFLQIEINNFSPKFMELIMSSEDISIPEVDLFSILKDWIAVHQDYASLASLIRYGTMFYSDLIRTVAKETFKDNPLFATALVQHEVLISETLKSNLKQFSVRNGHKYQPPFFPLADNISRTCNRNGSSAVVSSSPVAIIYPGNIIATCKINSNKSDLTRFSISISSLTSEWSCEIKAFANDYRWKTDFTGLTVKITPKYVELQPEGFKMHAHSAHSMHFSQINRLPVEDPTVFMGIRTFFDESTKRPYPWLVAFKIQGP